MVEACYLLIAIGFLGAFDIWRFHTREHHLRSLPSARVELISHSLRGPTYAILFLAIPNLAMRGWWFVALLALLVFDAAISIFDFSVERKSRAPVGGLPTGEYVVHSIIAILFGAFVAFVWIDGKVGLEQATSLSVEPAVPDPVRALLAVMAVGVFVSGVQDASAVVRLGKRAEDA